jgi:hypothetical protein
VTGVRPAWFRGSAVVALGLWALAMLGIPAMAWLDRLLRQAGRPDLAPMASSDATPLVLAMVSAATVVEETMQPTRVSIWLTPAARGREP